MRNIHAFPLSGSFSHASSNSAGIEATFCGDARDCPEHTAAQNLVLKHQPLESLQVIAVWQRRVAEASQKDGQSTSMRSLAILGLSNTLTARHVHNPDVNTPFAQVWYLQGHVFCEVIDPDGRRGFAGKRLAIMC